VSGQLGGFPAKAFDALITTTAMVVERTSSRLACGSGSGDFSGGMHGAASVLRKLGFEVRNVRSPAGHE
jgi:hypothetical protein